MQMLRDLFALRHGVKQLMRAVLRVRGHEAYDEIAVDIIYLAQKRCKIHLALAVVSVGIDILPEQGYFFISAPDNSRASLTIISLLRLRSRPRT